MQKNIKKRDPAYLTTALRILAVLLVVAVAAGARWHAVVNLPVDYDEDDYTRAAQQFTALIRSGNWNGFLETNYRPEHPPLEKIVFGISLLSTPEVALTPDRPTSAEPDKYLSRKLLRPERTISAVFGTLEVFLLALVNPLAGLFLGIHAFTIKYTSQVMIESLPSLTSLACILAYLRWKKSTKHQVDGWLISSAVFLGLTAASKYLYCVVGVAILVDWLLDSHQAGSLRRDFRLILAWGILALIVFIAADPYLWPDIISRLKDSILYHSAYASGASEVENAGYPTWQPFVWLSISPYSWHPKAFFLAIDPFITLAAAFGVTSLWKKQRLYILWLGFATFFLLIWPTKWPQYLLILTAPLSLAAYEGLMNLTVRPLRKWLVQRKSKKKLESPNRRGDGRRALPWLVPGLIAFAVLTIFPLIFQLGISMTDFSVTSIRDGFNGGIWREIWGGLTGQIQATGQELGRTSAQVHYTGPALYQPVLSYLGSSGLLVFNILWTILTVLLQTIMGLGIALLLWQRGIRFRRFWQALFILPWAIPEMIGALMWLNIFMPEWGWLALAAQKYGPHFPFAFLVDSGQSANLQLLILLIPAIWYGFPFMMLASSVGLKMIPPETLDAAAVDGASAWNTFRYVIWPLLLPLIVPAIIIRSIFAFNQFYLFQVMRSDYSTLATISYNIFNPTSGSYGMRGGMFSVSAVINILTVIILAGFVILFNRWSKAGEGVTYA
jgi:ABC-type sugar transport system permease subunit